MVVVHFVDVGQGNMTLVEMPDGTIFLYDCNVTDENGDRVLGYLRTALYGRRIAFFVNSHREADHMRGIKRIIREFPIPIICDNGESGGTTDCTEYKEYMEVRRNAQRFTVSLGQVWPHGSARVRVFNAANALLAQDPNAQSIVLKIENLNPATGAVANSVMLTGDSDAAAWEKWIVPVHRADLASTILLASHHGAATFFTRADGTRYTAHLAAIKPVTTVISVGDNTYGHPDPAAIRAYDAASTGSDDGIKIVRTDQSGSIRLVLNDDSSWRMTWPGPSPRPPRPALPARLPATLLPGFRSLPARRPASILRGLVTPSASPPKPRSVLEDMLLDTTLAPKPNLTPPPRSLSVLRDMLMGETPPPHPKSGLGDILQGLATPPKALSLSEIAEQILKTAPPKKKTPEEEFAEWLMKQRLWPPK
jgi:beta-lactamase superfamily II metal-dependent hydrolase